jgi:hypothetical protein
LSWHTTAQRLDRMATRFQPMIWIREGSVMVRPIDSIEEALAFLEHWHGDRGAVFHFTKIEMEKALVGDVDIEDARQAFWRFAEDASILGESSSLNSSGRGRTGLFRDKIRSLLAELSASWLQRGKAPAKAHKGKIAANDAQRPRTVQHREPKPPTDHASGR